MKRVAGLQAIEVRTIYPDTQLSKIDYDANAERGSKPSIDQYAIVAFEGKISRVYDAYDQTRLRCVEILSRREFVASFENLHLIIQVHQPDLAILAETDPETFEVGVRRYIAIEPLLGHRLWGDVANRSREIKINHATLKAWLDAYEAIPDVRSLIPKRNGRRPGFTRLDPMTKGIIDEAIHDVYLNKDCKPISAVVRRVEELCAVKAVRAPHYVTVYKHIKRIPIARILQTRGQEEQRKSDNAADACIFETPGMTYEEYRKLYAEGRSFS